MVLQAQKTCFSTLRRLVEICGGKDGPAEFVEFVYKQIVPACFLAPLRDTFDLNDAQTTLALSESALCLRAILEKRVRFLVKLGIRLSFHTFLLSLC
jgi:exportin-T